MSDTVTVEADNETGLDLDLDRWCDLVRAALVAEGVEGPAEASIRFVPAAVITELNRVHLDGSGPTDVLSFPLDEEPVGPTDPHGVRLIGDIVVCPDVAAENAPGHAGSFDDELALLLVHATLHLLGHDHADDDERDHMWDAERRLLAQLWPPLARDPWGDP